MQAGEIPEHRGALVRETSAPGVTTHRSPEEGPVVLLLLGLHGDEAGDVEASLRALVDELLERGTVRVVRCFPEQPTERCIGPREEDPNRVFPPNDAHGDDFAVRQRLLMRLVQDSEIVIDVHRYHQRAGGPIAFPFDAWGVEMARKMGVERTVVGLVETVDGALAMWSHLQGRRTLVLEAGPKSAVKSTDHDVLIAAHALLLALDMTTQALTEGYLGEWPQGPPLLRCHGAVPAEGLTAKQREALDREPHLGPLSEKVVATLDLHPDSRLLMINPNADPVAFACLPEGDLTPAS